MWESSDVTVAKVYSKTRVVTAIGAENVVITGIIGTQKATCIISDRQEIIRNKIKSVTANIIEDQQDGVYTRFIVDVSGSKNGVIAIALYEENEAMVAVHMLPRQNIQPIISQYIYTTAKAFYFEDIKSKLPKCQWYDI